MSLKVLSYSQKPLKDYIADNVCARRGRCESYLETAEINGILREDIEKPKRLREAPAQRLNRAEIEKLVLGKTLRRPCFDLFFSADGTAKCSWVDSLDDIPKSEEDRYRAELGLTYKPDISYALPIFHQGTWQWGNDEMSIIRDFGSCYGKPLKTEFFVQDNGLLSVKSHNENETIWYDLLVLDSDLVDSDFCVKWEDIENIIDHRENNLREYQANSAPQHLHDEVKRAW